MSGSENEADLDLQYLRAELARIDVAIRRQVQCWIRAGRNPSDPFTGLYISDADATALMERELGSNWSVGAMLDQDEIAAFDQAGWRATEAARNLEERAQQVGHRLRLRQVRQAFDLDDFGFDTLLICLAPQLDLRYERVYGYLQDDVTRKSPSVNLILDLLGGSALDRLGQLPRFSPDASLLRSRLIRTSAESDSASHGLLGRRLSADQTVVAWLLGSYQPPPELRGLVELWMDKAHPMDSSHALQAISGIGSSFSDVAILAFWGPDKMAQATAARLLACEHHRPLLALDLAGLGEGRMSQVEALRLVLRDARLLNALPYFHGWDACLDGDAPSIELMGELFGFPGTSITSGRRSWRPSGTPRSRRFAELEFRIPSAAERRELWMSQLEDVAPGAQVDVSDLAGQFRLSSGQIHDAARTAMDRAYQGRRTAVGEDDLFTSARAHSSTRLKELARKVEPRYGWDDIVLPEDQVALLQEIVATVRGRPQVLEEWQVGAKLASSAGVTMLFAGPPGTGKTMAAEIIAGELGLDLYKIDLSTVVSKYIGETEKNLEQIFTEAASSNAILFFDEADALFGKRSEVRDSHDRYANIEISYLLQRMEAYDGVTILATNLRANLDEAFTRRLQFAVDFPFPEGEDRLRLWKSLFPPEVPRSPSLDFPMLAREFELAGGDIRNILVSAAFLASADGGEVTIQHLLHGTRRELQKMGRLISETKLNPLDDGPEKLAR